MEIGKYFLSMKTKAAHNLCPLFPSALFIPHTGIIPCIFVGQRQAKHLVIHKSQPHSENLMKGWLKLLPTKFQNIRIFLNAIKNLNRFPKTNPA